MITLSIYDYKIREDTIVAIRDEIKEQNQKVLEERSNSEKLKHFWHYYKVHVCVGAVILAFITYLVLHYTVFRPLPYAFIGYALDSNYCIADNTDAVDAFMQDFAAHEEINTEEYQAYFDVSNSLDTNSTHDYNIAIDMKLSKAGAHGDMDVLIGSVEQIEMYEINGFYRPPLKEILPEAFFQELDEQGLIHYFKPDEYGTDYPIGIYIKDAPRIQELELYPEDAEPVLAIVSLSPRTEMAVSFVEYIFETP